MSHRRNGKIDKSKEVDNEKDITSSSIMNIEENISEKYEQRRFRVQWRFVILLSLLWIALINYEERVSVKKSIQKCHWNNWETWPKEADVHRVGLIADPQIMDAHSYPGRPDFINRVTQWILDNYLKRNWKFIQYYLDPDTNIFVGDLFDGGRNWNDTYWHEEYERFNKIFPKKPMRRTIMSLPGNHDIGFGDTIIEDSLKRFSTYFGEPSSYYDIGNHTFVLLDTMSLSNRKNLNISRVPKEFINNFAHGYHPYPKILLSHVPLYRNPDQQTCGPLRESKKPFPMQRGVQYQTVIEYEISQEVLTKIQPSILFSGDDHDFCQVTHSYIANGESKLADEITVKSCAMNMGVKKPAIQLLSLYNPNGESPTNDKKTFQTNICYMPNPYNSVMLYLLGVVISAGLLIQIHFFPTFFNQKVVANMERTFKDHKMYTVLPLPVSTTFGPKSWLSASVYKVPETKSLINFAADAIILTIIVLLVFSYYFTSA